MLRNLPSLYIQKYVKVLFEFNYKRAYDVVDILRYDNVSWIYSIQHN